MILEIAINKFTYAEKYEDDRLHKACHPDAGLTGKGMGSMLS